MDPIDPSAATATLTLPFWQMTSEPGLMAADSFCWCYILTSTFHYCCSFLDTLMKWFCFCFFLLIGVFFWCEKKNASDLVSLGNCIPLRHFSFLMCWQYSVGYSLSLSCVTQRAVKSATKCNNSSHQSNVAAVCFIFFFFQRRQKCGMTFSVCARNERNCADAEEGPFCPPNGSSGQQTPVWYVLFFFCRCSVG